MSGKLEIRLNMNSEVEDVLAFKTCCSMQVQDPNLEILVTNLGTGPIDVKSGFDLETDTDTKNFPGLFPPGARRIQPGDTAAFYCQMDEKVWKSARRLTFHDTAGNPYRVEITR